MIKYGILFFAGLLIQILSSSMWQNIPSEKIGEMVFYSGQAVGELCYFICIRYLFKGYGFFTAIVEFGMSLLIVDLITIFFLNPYEVSVSKYFGFCVASVILLFRLRKYTKLNG